MTKILFLDSSNLVFAGYYQKFLQERFQTDCGPFLRLIEQPEYNVQEWSRIFHYNFAAAELMRFYRGQIGKAYSDPSGFSVSVNGKKRHLKRSGYWINPIYRTQFLGITGTEADYESMLFTSDKITQKHIKREMELTELQSLILDVIRFRTAKFTNRSIKGLNVYTEYNNAFSKYKLYMEEHHKEAYHTARNFPAQQCLVDENGFILLEQNQSDEELKGEIKNE